jgi:hypothetical protein
LARDCRTDSPAGNGAARIHRVFVHYVNGVGGTSIAASARGARERLVARFESHSQRSSTVRGQRASRGVPARLRRRKWIHSMNVRHMITTTAAILLMATPSFAQKGNGAPSGGHYNLNIIGVSNPKTQPLTGGDRHTIFVALGKTATVQSKIYLYQGEDFSVCDGNAFNSAIDCAGNTIASSGAVFQLPCNLNISLDGADALAPCDGGAEDSYEVWARAVGKPGGSAVMTTCATEVGDADGDGIAGETICSTENTVDILTRKTGQPVFQNVTNELTSLVACVDTDPDPNVVDLFCTRYALFRDEFTDYFWQYDNSGLKLAQIRFYPVE